MADSTGRNSTELCESNHRSKRRKCEERLEDVFQEVADRFNRTEFKKFACAGRGLRLDHHVVQNIQDSRDDVNEQKIQMLRKWKCNTGENATCEQIRKTIEDYLDGTRDQSNGDEIHLPASIKMFFKEPLDAEEKIFSGTQETSTMSRQLAVKLLLYRDENLLETQILQKLAYHQNVVSIIHSDILFQGCFKYIYIAMERCGHQNLYERIMETKQKKLPFDPKLAIHLAKQVVLGLGHIHKKDVLHRDLKPENILFAIDDPNIVKIVDFGLSKKIQTGKSKTRHTKAGFGSTGYMAPETHEKNGQISKKTDIFSLGVLLYFLWSDGEHPFGSVPTLWDHNIVTKQSPCLDNILIPNAEKAKFLLCWMLKPEQNDRPTTDEILENWFEKESCEEHVQTGTATTAKVVDNSCGEPKCKNGHGRAGEHLEVGNGATHVGEEDERTTCVLFDKTLKKLVAYDPIKAHKKNVQNMLTELVTQTYSAVTVGDCIYALTWRRYVLMTKPFHSNLPYGGWLRMTSPQARMEHGHGEHPPAAVLGGCIYVCGGGWEKSRWCDADKTDLFPVTSACEKYDTKTESWRSIPELSIARRHNILVEAGGCIYCIGGQNKDSKLLASVEKFDPSVNQWVKAAPLKRARQKSAAAVLNGKIYVLGGEDGQGVMNDVECYDPVLDAWTPTVSMQMRRTSFKAFVIKGKLFAIGGNKKGKQSVEMLDKKTVNSKWKTISLLDNAIEPMATVAFEF